MTIQKCDMNILISAVKIISVIMLAASLVLIMSIQRRNEVNISHSSPPIPVAAIVSPTLVPAPKVLISQMDSPEGRKTLAVERVESTGLPLHSIVVTSKSDGVSHKILNADATYHNLTIPFNTWSPDTAYFFLKETTVSSTDYLVFQSSGDLFSNTARSLSVQKLFREKVEGYIIEDVTGWADPTLLVVNTKEIAGDNKISFWFDVLSQTFIQLGTYFK